MELLDGKKIKLEILKDLKQKIEQESRKPGLVVIQIGEDPASSVYVTQKQKMADNLSIDFEHLKLSESVSEEEVLKIIDKFNEDNTIDGILVQMPIPSHLNSKKIQNAVRYEKDVDGLTDLNMGKLVHNEDSLVPCTPMGIIDLLDAYNIQIEEKKVVIVGRSDLVGKPLFNLMLNRNATVTLAHSKTQNLKDITKQADILVAAIGKANFITKDYLKKDAIVIDVGINRVDDKLCGDVDFEDVKEHVSYITPVPGGVGQMTVAELGKNVYKAFILKKHKN